MIAYFLLVHRYPAQFKRLFKAIYAPGNQYVIHVDKSSGADLAQDIAAFLAPYSDVEILEPRDALWGGYSLVEAELRGMARLLEMDSAWTHYINLSGQDFPLKGQEYIRQFFAANPGKQFIRALDQRRERPDTMNRVSHLFVEEDGKMTATGVARPYLPDATPFIGTQWKAVTRSFCEFVCHDPRADRFKTFYRNSFIADEAFFQTVIMNSGDQGIVMNDDLRMIDWVPDGDIKLRRAIMMSATSPFSSTVRICLRANSIRRRIRTSSRCSKRICARPPPTSINPHVLANSRIRIDLRNH